MFGHHSEVLKSEQIKLTLDHHPYNSHHSSVLLWHSKSRRQLGTKSCTEEGVGVCHCDPAKACILPHRDEKHPSEGWW